MQRPTNHTSYGRRSAIENIHQLQEPKGNYQAKRKQQSQTPPETKIKHPKKAESPASSSVERQHRPSHSQQAELFVQQEAVEKRKSQNEN